MSQIILSMTTTLPKPGCLKPCFAGSPCFHTGRLALDNWTTGYGSTLQRARNDPRLRRYKPYNPTQSHVCFPRPGPAAPERASLILPTTWDSVDASMSSMTVPFSMHVRSSIRLWRDSVATWGLLQRSPPFSTFSSNLIHLDKRGWKEGQGWWCYYPQPGWDEAWQHRVFNDPWHVRVHFFGFCFIFILCSHFVNLRAFFIWLTCTGMWIIYFFYSVWFLNVRAVWMIAWYLNACRHDWIFVKSSCL